MFIEVLDKQKFTSHFIFRISNHWGFVFLRSTENTMHVTTENPAVLPVIPWFVKFQVLSSGRGVLDVAGGQGDLSWQLSTLLS